MDNLLVALAIAVAFIAGKLFSVSLGTFLSNKDARTSLMAGMGMLAMGEFSFVIAKTAFDLGAVDQLFSSVIGAALVTMFFPPPPSAGPAHHRAERGTPSLHPGIAAPGGPPAHIRTDMGVWMNARRPAPRGCGRYSGSSST